MSAWQPSSQPRNQVGNGHRTYRGCSAQWPSRGNLDRAGEGGTPVMSDAHLPSLACPITTSDYLVNQSLNLSSTLARFLPHQFTSREMVRAAYSGLVGKSRARVWGMNLKALRLLGP